ncbi:hypothetical protein PaG_01000 [Moesziomyces aphidis]|uniref:TTI1 C-terminal TPR domain-containing protein n=1 Tax=Moesziomyces aphidis TaxID=84754 RepID=W3VSP2_MOEAP|nr:hypothetical protein PaG_01000 [Moesziomyces aphidis]
MLSSSAAGPFRQGPLGSSTAQTPFQRLKPVCVELLWLAGRSAAPAQTKEVVTSLRRLESTLQAVISEQDSIANDGIAGSSSSTSRLVSRTRITLPTSLVNYVFYPISELITAAPKGISSLAESVTESILDVLALLVDQWWADWSLGTSSSSPPASSKWQVWGDLVILASSVVGTAPNATEPRRSAGDEVKLAALRVLNELLTVRFEADPTPGSRGDSAAAKAADEWEWDGVSDLPSLDDAEEPSKPATKRSTSNKASSNEASTRTNHKVLFPTPEHFKHVAADKVAKGAISFVLSTSFALAESSSESTEVRTTAIAVARSTLLVWIGGVCPLPADADSAATRAPVVPLYCIGQNQGSNELANRKASSLRLRPLLPGITSSLTRLATSRVRTKQDGTKPKATPAPVAAAAIEVLGDLLRATVSHVCLDDTMEEHVVGGGQNGASMPDSSPFANLTDLSQLVDASSRDENGSDAVTDIAEAEPGMHPDASAETSNQGALKQEAKWALSTLAQIHLALRTFSPLTQPSLPGTSLPSTVPTVVQRAVLDLAVALLSDCGTSFAWLDDHLQGMARLDGTSAQADSAKPGEGTSTSSISTLLTWIVDLASESNTTSVVESAKFAFHSLQGATTLPALKDGTAFWSLLMQALDALPAAVTVQSDESVSRLTLRVNTLLQLAFARSEEHGNGAPARVREAALTQFAQELPSRILRLVALLKTEGLEFVDERSDIPGAHVGSRLQPAFAGLEASTSRHLSRMFFQLGRTLAFAFVQELGARQTGAKTDRGDVFAVVPLLVERAAKLRSIRLPGIISTGGADRTGREDARNESLSSLAVAAELMAGISSWIDNIELGLRFAGMANAAPASKSARKVAHRLGKKVFGLVVDMLDGDAEEAVAGRQRSDLVLSRADLAEGGADAIRREHDVVKGEGVSLQAVSDSLVERVKGISLATEDIESATPLRHGPALDLGFVRAANLSKVSGGTVSRAQQEQALQHRYVKAERSVDLSNALAFALVGSSSKLLGQNFRALLLRGAYPLISGMSASPTASSDLVRRASAAAMREIAFNTAYGDVKNCLLDHADYILGSACQRLISGLDEELRAIAGIDGRSKSGAAAVARGDGAVNAGQGDRIVLPLVSAQRAPFVLVEMIRVLGSEVVPMVEDAIDEVLDALDRFHAHPSICGGLLAVLDSILETMAAEQTAKQSSSSKARPSLLSVPDQRSQTEVEDFEAWLAARRREQAAFDEADGNAEAKQAADEKGDKPSKSQQVAAQILEKAAVFLTHPSPVLRSHVLELLRHGVETLAPQGRTGELLPIVNSAWPHVMTRLGASYSSGSTSRSSQLTPIIDLDRIAIGAAGRAQSDAFYAQNEAALVEKDPQVWVAAARFVEAAAQHVPDFVGKRVVEEAWPRFEQLLTLLRWKFHPRSGRAHASETRERHAVGLVHDLDTAPSNQKRPSTVHDHIQPPFILPSPTGVPAQLTLAIVTTLTSVVSSIGARLPDDAAWSITTHPFLLDLLDVRQPPALLSAAESLYVELGRRNAPATVWALQTAFPKPAAKALRESAPVPCFLAHAHAAVQEETLHQIVSLFKAA